MIAIADNKALDTTSVSYEGAPVAEVSVEGVDYRIDAGIGSAVAISQRPAGTSTWVPVVQGRWDGVRLRARPLDHSVVSSLERALAQATSEQQDAFA